MGHKNILGIDKYVHYLSCGDDFTSVCICQNSKCICGLLYDNYTLMLCSNKLLEKNMRRKKQNVTQLTLRVFFRYTAKLRGKYRDFL